MNPPYTSFLYDMRRIDRDRARGIAGRDFTDRVIVSQQGLTVDLRTDGLSSVVRDMLAPRPTEKAA